MSTPERPALHRSRSMAESFGTDASAYDAARPQYPEALVARIVAGLAGREVLDVGCGTGIAARQLQAADCTVLGVEPDPRMAGFARDTGVPVEVATFEEWDPRGRSFDAVIAAQSWHWVDPDAGPAKAAEVLRPGGRLAVFGHVFEPPATVAEAFAEAFRAAVPDSPFQGGPRPVEAYTSAYDAVAQRIHSTGAFEEPEVWRFDWRRDYTRDEWLALLPTTGGLTRVSPGALHSVLDAVGVAIDALGGAFTMEYATLGTAASRL